MPTSIEEEDHVRDKNGLRFHPASIVYQSTSLAQQPSDYYGPPPVEYHPVSPWPPSMGESYHHDSTRVGNYLRNLAGLIHARGNYLLSRSQAAILYEYACSLNNYNREQWIEFYRGNLQRLTAEQQAHLAATRANNKTKRPVIFRAAYLLTDEELNRKTGEIRWPTVLQGAEYVKLRSTLDNLFQTFASGPSGAAVSANRIAECAEALRGQVRRNIKRVERNDYNAAQNFLCGLKYEPEFSKPVNLATSVSVDDSHKLGMN